MLKGRIIKALSGFYYVEHDGAVYETRARGKFRKTQETPHVGDFVTFQIENESGGSINEIHERKNPLNQPPDSNTLLLSVMKSTRSPDFNFYPQNLFLTYAEAHTMEPFIINKKKDVNDDPAKHDEITKVYEGNY